MKNPAGNFTLRLLTICLLIVTTGTLTTAQEIVRISPYITFQYLKNSENVSFLKAVLMYSGENGEAPLPGMKLTFYTTEGKNQLGSSVTDSKGMAVYSFDASAKPAGDQDGTWAFKADFEGNDTTDVANAEITVRDVNLEMLLTLVDTIKTITLNATMTDKGQIVPVSGEVVKVYVPRMFSNLTITEATLDENGTATFEFPTDIPGDSLGNLQILARFEEHTSFGTVEKLSVQQWGVPTYYIIPKIHRALWTKTPPMWMIVTLSILLIGVWGHYMFAVISLVMIKIDARRKKAKDEYRL